MDTVYDVAARCGIATEYFDGFGQRRTVPPATLDHVCALICPDRPQPRRLPGTIVLRLHRENRIALQIPSGQVSWEIKSAGTAVANGTTDDRLVLPEIAPGTFDLCVTAADGAWREAATLLVAPETAFQGKDPAARLWALAVQLYGVRSRRNWGHGDFTDLAALIALAAKLGAAGIALNPLHALFDDRPEQASPYSPNSRLFLNVLYIDVEAIAEFRGVRAAGLEQAIERLRDRDIIDYAGVAAAKLTGLRLAYEQFRAAASEQRRAAFAAFRHERGLWLERFAGFEVLRRRLPGVWWDWPDEWRRPDEARLRELRREDDAFGFFEFVQWIADAQLAQCCAKARELHLPIGLYIDVAVGVEAGGADAWSEQDAILNSLSVGAPPDPWNAAGQSWGLSGFSPSGLAATRFEPFRQMLREAMRHAGAVRLDHVLGLRRLFVIPHGMKAQDGTYIEMPFEALLAVVAQESVRQRCTVIGEDLGTVPEGFRETIGEWGLWSYLVMMFERHWDNGSFRAPGEYKRNALATFNTHDLPTFAGWTAEHDIRVKRALGLDPGETEDDRQRTLAHLRAALAAQGIEAPDFAGVAKYLAATPSRLVVVAMEDALGLIDQPNIPGTIDEHPNWRRRLPVALEELPENPGLRALAAIMAEAGRGAT
jgi:4-alpha-glucanotransferase